MSTDPATPFGLTDDGLLGLFDRVLKPLSTEWGDHYIEGNFWVWLREGPLAETIAKSSFAEDLARSLDNEVAVLSRRESDLAYVRIRSPYSVLQLLWLALEPALQSLRPYYPYFIESKFAIEGVLRNRESRASADDAITKVRAWRQAIADAQLRPVLPVALPVPAFLAHADSASPESLPIQEVEHDVADASVVAAIPSQLGGIQAADNSATQLDDPAIRGDTALVPSVEPETANARVKRKGRPRLSTEDEDKSLYEMRERTGMNYDQLGERFGMSGKQAKQARDRHRKRL